jgi:hypothetical protein
MDPFYTPPIFPETDKIPAFAGYRLLLHTVAHCCILLHTGQFRTGDHRLDRKVSYIWIGS